MPGPTNTLLIEGTFEELVDELAQYIDDLRKKQSEDSPLLRSEITPLLEQGSKDDALKRLVSGSSILNSAPEKEFTAAYNLLIHLVRQSPNNDKFLPKICQNLSQPITSSPSNGPGLALSILSTIFNILPSSNDVRYHVFLAILRVIRSSSLFETLRPQLKNLDSWVAEWDTDAEDQRTLYLSIADAAAEAGDADESYNYLLRALRTIPPAEASTEESQQLSIRALKAALSHPSHFDFQDLTALDSIQALRNSHPNHFEVLELFSAELLDDYHDFLTTHPGFLSSESLREDVLERKMRLLTLASIAASSATRSLPYAQIASALQVPSGDVEMWVIDVIRAGLVEGKLSQLNKTFLIHRSTYRVFGEKQWVEVSGRLDTWRASLEGVLAVVKGERERMVRETEVAENGVKGAGQRDGVRGGMGGVRRREIDVME
ncbi:MAG: hypothetical protein HETSPECPRED_005647 [Heterodermia speciosa]|uniref:Eukaryotic translation initiation factor 3 subunit M n=1 Tax=Heterodermia speciosa TaxID=116794 RepID=A0A8H3FHG0_9LECA|nr:MAG: hypothetical protein HETSPECPRED_005647 [Heterodermia speciosa]